MFRQQGAFVSGTGTYLKYIKYVQNKGHSISRKGSKQDIPYYKYLLTSNHLNGTQFKLAITPMARTPCYRNIFFFFGICVSHRLRTNIANAYTTEIMSTPARGLTS